jgi:hypothetical protein
MNKSFKVELRLSSLYLPHDLSSGWEKTLSLVEKYPTWFAIMAKSCKKNVGGQVRIQQMKQLLQVANTIFPQVHIEVSFPSIPFKHHFKCLWNSFHDFILIIMVNCQYLSKIIRMWNLLSWISSCPHLWPSVLKETNFEELSWCVMVVVLFIVQVLLFFTK